MAQGHLILFAGALGIEPRLLVLETKVLPLNDTPSMLSVHIIQQKRPLEQGSFLSVSELALGFFECRVFAAEATVL